MSIQSTNITGEYSTLKELYDRLIAVGQYNASMMFKIITGVIIDRRFPRAYKNTHGVDYTVGRENGEMRAWKTTDTNRTRKPFHYTLTAEERSVCSDMLNRLMA